MYELCMLILLLDCQRMMIRHVWQCVTLREGFGSRYMDSFIITNTQPWLKSSNISVYVVIEPNPRTNNCLMLVLRVRMIWLTVF